MRMIAHGYSYCSVKLSCSPLFAWGSWRGRCYCLPLLHQIRKDIFVCFFFGFLKSTEQSLILIINLCKVTDEVVLPKCTNVLFEGKRWMK